MSVQLKLWLEVGNQPWKLWLRLVFSIAWMRIIGGVWRSHRLARKRRKGDIPVSMRNNSIPS